MKTEKQHSTRLGSLINMDLKNQKQCFQNQFFTIKSFFLTFDSSSGSVSYGEPLNLGAGETHTKSYDWTLDSNWPNNSAVSWSAEDLTLIAFVQFDNSGPNEKKIFQVEALHFD